MAQYNRLKMVLLSLAIAASTQAALSSVAFASPNGGTGKAEGTWKGTWTRVFSQCFDKYGKNLEKAQKSAKDGGEFCSSTSVEPKDYWFGIFMPLASKESRFDPDATGQNGEKVPLGLYQMNADDMKAHKCKGLNGETIINAKDPFQAICCAIQIADGLAGKGFDSISGGSGKAASEKGIMSAFWQPMRKGMGGDGKGGKNAVNNEANLKDIKTAAKKYCESSPTSREEDITSPFSESGGSSSSSNSSRKTRGMSR